MRTTTTSATTINAAARQIATNNRRSPNRIAYLLKIAQKAATTTRRAR